MIIHALTAPPEAAFDAWLNPFVMNLWMASAADNEIVAIDSGRAPAVTSRSSSAPASATSACAAGSTRWSRRRTSR